MVAYMISDSGQARQRQQSLEGMIVLSATIFYGPGMMIIIIDGVWQAGKIVAPMSLIGSSRLVVSMRLIGE